MEKATDKSNAATSAVEKASVAKAASWTDKQQKQLESGLRKFPQGKLPNKDRWEKIAADVDEKSPADCQARFDELVAMHRKK